MIECMLVGGIVSVCVHVYMCVYRGCMCIWVCVYLGGCSHMCVFAYMEHHEPKS